jgi:hypothetical protein
MKQGCQEAYTGEVLNLTSDKSIQAVPNNHLGETVNFCVKAVNKD